MTARTEALYYDDPLLDRVEARVLGSESGGRLVELDRTLFYPEGGGQPCDLGSISGAHLEAVVEEGGRILHRLSEPLEAAPGERVELSLDRARRRDHTEQHSAQHLLSGLFWSLRGIQTRSFHLGPDRSTIDLDIPDLGEELLDETEGRANEMIGAATPFIVHSCPPEDPASLPLRKLPPAGEALVRIVEIAGLDYSPCCGTHVRDAGALRLVKILEAERYKGISRLSFVAGGRALDEFARIYRSAREAARAISAPPSDLGPESRRLTERIKELTLSERYLLRALVASEIERAAAAGLPLAVLRLPGPGSGAVDEAGKAFAERGIAGLALAGLTALAAAPAGRVLPASIREKAVSLGGRGGGPATAFRAVFPDAAALEAFASEAARALGAPPVPDAPK